MAGIIIIYNAVHGHAKFILLHGNPFLQAALPVFLPLVFGINGVFQVGDASVFLTVFLCRILVLSGDFAANISTLGLTVQDIIIAWNLLFRQISVVPCSLGLIIFRFHASMHMIVIVVATPCILNSQHNIFSLQKYSTITCIWIHSFYSFMLYIVFFQGILSAFLTCFAIIIYF